jgi:hypothetical protein
MIWYIGDARRLVRRERKKYETGKKERKKGREKQYLRSAKTHTRIRNKGSSVTLVG